MRIIKVKLKENSYNIYVGKDILKNIGILLQKRVKGKKILVISNKKVYRLYGEILRKSLEKSFNYNKKLIPDGEKYKNLETIKDIYKSCLKYKLDRASTIIGLGGGVIGDIAGFVASTFMRGINLVHVPTTLLSQVDSSIGGKTGVDLEEGKNLIGTFYQPIFVLSDIRTLKTLDILEFKNGLAEVIKYGIIMDEDFFYYLKNNASDILNQKENILSYIVYKSAKNKVKVVEKDEKEKSGFRAILNYGHTIGHAIESAGGYSMYKHGEAISIGMLIAANISKKMKLCSEEVVKEHKEIFKKFGLIFELRGIKLDNIIRKLYSDKKIVNNKIRFILTKQIGCVSFIKNIDINIVRNEILSYMKKVGG